MRGSVFTLFEYCQKSRIFKTKIFFTLQILQINSKIGYTLLRVLFKNETFLGVIFKYVMNDFMMFK